MQGSTTDSPINKVTHRIIGCALEVHRALGPGLLESTYEACLAREMQIADVPFVRQWPIPIHYRGSTLDCGYRADFCVEEKVLVELKAVEQVLPLHEAQILTYLKLSELRIALLINFNVPQLREGIRRFIS